MTISILLADDHPVVRLGIRTLLESAPDFSVVGEASDGLETIRLIERLRPDVLVLDLMMPGLSGLEALRTRRASWSCPCTTTKPSWRKLSRTAPPAMCSRATARSA